MIKNILQRIRNRWLDARLELNLTVIDFCKSRVATFRRRKRNLLKGQDERKPRLPQVVNVDGLKNRGKRVK